MEITNLLADNKKEILNRWVESLMISYPEDNSGILKSRKKQYTESVVGQTYQEGLEAIFRSIIEHSDRESVHKHLDNIIRIRAIQEIDPSVAINFVFNLKQIIRDCVVKHAGKAKFINELLDIESRIDAIAILSFDIFMQCREKLYELRANEMRNWTYRIVKNSGMYREAETDK